MLMNVKKGKQMQIQCYFTFQQFVVKVRNLFGLFKIIVVFYKFIFCFLRIINLNNELQIIYYSLNK